MILRGLANSTMSQDDAAAKGTEKASPRHIAIIMDGNGRWAESRGKPRTAGHREGAEALRKLLASLKEFPETKYLTLYAFSSENWGRPENEVNDLMGLLQYYLQREAKLLHEQNIRLNVIGDIGKLSKDLQARIQQIMQDTKPYDTLHLNIALSYGARQEIANAVKLIAQQASEGTLRPEEITEELISQKLYTHDIPDPDLLIRTGGEQRLSNFLLWQSAYTELYFTGVLWPDFTSTHLGEAIACYCGRERRYGSL